MRFINKMLAADEGYELKFKNDRGGYNESGFYVAPSFFLSCFPAKSINTIKKAQEIFEEIKIIEKNNYIELCKQQYILENPLPTIEEEIQEQNIEEEE